MVMVQALACEQTKCLRSLPSSKQTLFIHALMSWYDPGNLALGVLGAIFLVWICWVAVHRRRCRRETIGSEVTADIVNSPEITSDTLEPPRLIPYERTPLLRGSAAGSATDVESSTAATPIVVGSQRSLERGFQPKSFASQKNSPMHRGVFNKAHDFVINDSVIVNYDQVEPEEVVLRWVAEHTISGAEFDSSARDPPPQCHPGTRLHVLEMITSWLYDINRRYQLMWLHGPAGVGKSAIIQSIAETTFAAGVLGATLFFSRPNNRNNPNLVFTTIAYQLAVKIPRYRKYLRSKMIHDPRMLEKGMKELFELLFVTPFGYWQQESKHIFWLILLDGLDECRGDRAQVEVVHLISNFVMKYPDAPLIWVISSRPEPHIKDVFNSPSIKPSRWEHFLPVDSDDSCRDVELYLSHAFDQICQKYPYIVAPWPTEEQFMRIAKAASGLFVFAVTLAMFIDDTNVGDPITHLNLVLELSINTSQDPLESLHALYTKILDNVPRQLLPTTQLLLGFCLVRREFFGLEECTFQFACNVLGLAHHVAWAALIKLHSVVRVPIPHFSDAAVLSFFHASFGDYLKDERRSQQYMIDLDVVRKHLWDRCVQILLGINVPDKENFSALHVSLSWPRMDPESNTRMKGKLIQKAFLNWISQLLHAPPFVEHFFPSVEHLQRPFGIDDLNHFFEELDFSRLMISYMDRDGDSSPEEFASWALTAELPEKLRETRLVQQTSLQFLDLSLVDTQKVSLAFHYQDTRVDLVCCGETVKDLKQYFPTPFRVDNGLLAQVARLKAERLSAGLPDVRAAVVGKTNTGRACAVVYSSDWKAKTVFFLPLR